MKNIKLIAKHFALSIVLCVGVNPTYSATPIDFNVLETPVFVNTYSPWTNWGPEPEITIDPTVGQPALGMSGAGAIEQVVSVEKFTFYVLEATIAIPAGSQVNIGIKAANPNNIGDGEQYLTIIGDGSWARHTFVVNTGQHGEMKAYVYLPDAGDTANVFNVFLYPRDTGPVALNNPSFENSVLTGWNLWGSTATLNTNYDNSVDGPQSLSLDGRGGINQLAPTEVGQLYRLTGWSQSVNGETVNVGAKPTLERADAYRLSNNTDWVENAVYFTASQTQTQIYGFIPSETGAAVFDGYKLEAVFDNQILANGHFYDQLENWTTSGEVAVVPHGRDEPRDSIYLGGQAKISQSIPVSPNTNYTIAADLKSNVVGKNIRYGFQVKYDNNITQTNYNFTFNQEWTTVSHLLTTDSANVVSAIFFVETPLAEGVGEVANIEIIKN